jgi:hypothetical protein
MKIAAFILTLLFCSGGWAENRKKIVVIDTGIYKNQENKKYMCKNGAYNMSENAEKGPYSVSKHGPNVIGLIGERINTDRFCVVSIKFMDGDGSSIYTYYSALVMTLGLKNVVAVNLSIASPPELASYSYLEDLYLRKILRRKIKIIAATGNNGITFKKSACFVFPACHKQAHLKNDNFSVVGSSTGNFSNKFKGFKVFLEDGIKKGTPKLSGSSQSTAIFTGKMFSK